MDEGYPEIEGARHLGCNIYRIDVSSKGFESDLEKFLSRLSVYGLEVDFVSKPYQNKVFIGVRGNSKEPDVTDDPNQ